MVKLVSGDDRLVMKNMKFVKNAVFYKDMLAFYDAYNGIMSKQKNELPSFCFLPSGEVCLEGVCLLMKNYQSEFNFESLRLTLNYLKTLYYSIASFSDDEFLPERKLIEHEFENYALASRDLAKKTKAEYNAAKNKYEERKNDYDKTSALYAKKLVGSNLLNAFSIVFMICAFVVSSIPFMFYNNAKLNLLVTCLISGVSILIGFTLHFLMKNHAQKMSEDASGLAYSLQQKKFDKNIEFEAFKAIKLKYSKILSEKNEYSNNFALSLDSFASNLSLDEILKRACEYNLLSYNLKLDIENIFVEDQKSVQEYVLRLDKISAASGSQTELSKAYKEILGNDQLFFNNEVRFAFLKKFSDVAENSHEWMLNLDGKRINPFDTNVKALVTEEITYLKNDSSLFVSANLDKFLNTNCIKSSKVLELRGINDADTLKEVKLEFLTHFYDYEKTKRYDNLFYDKRMAGHAKVTIDIEEYAQKVPTFVMLKLKAIECKLGLENSNYEIITKIMNDISNPSAELLESTSAPVSASEVNFDFLAEDFGDYVRYSIGNNVFLGYKLI